MTTVVLAATLTVKQHLRSKFFLILAVLQPLLFMTIVIWLSETDRGAVSDALASTTVMGMWSTTLFGAGRALQRERRHGTLELLLVAPTKLLLPLAGVCLGSASLGVLSAGTGVVVVAVLTGHVSSLVDSAVFLATLSGAVVCFAALGLLICVLFVLLRQAAVFTNVLEYPIWLACGLLIPLADRPDAVAALGDVLIPTHVGVLLRDAVGTGRLDVQPVLAVVVLSVAYLVAALMLVDRVARRVRRRGDLTIS